MTKGETVLILGATGVAGQLAIQVGAGTWEPSASLPRAETSKPYLRSDIDAIVPLGQSEDAIRESFAAVAAKGIDAVIDYLWGRPTELCLRPSQWPSIRTPRGRFAWSRSAKVPEGPSPCRVPLSAAWT